MRTKSKASALRREGPYSRRSATEWAKLIRQQRRSGRTVEAYCAQRGLAESTFWYWRRRVEVVVEDKPEVDAVTKFLAIPVSAPSQACEVRIGDLHVRLGDIAAQNVVEAIVARIARAA